MRKLVKVFSIPACIVDLFALTVFYLMVDYKTQVEEYKVQVDLLKTQIEQTVKGGMGTDPLILSIVREKSGEFGYVLESRKLGVKRLSGNAELSSELGRLNPAALILRVDKNAPFKFPASVISDAESKGIKIGFALGIKG